MPFSMKTRRRSKAGKNNPRKGAAAVELAVVAPVLFLILFMMIETSRYLMSRHAVTGAAREVARVTAVTGADDATGRSIARTFMERSSFNAESVDVALDFENSEVPGMRIVTAEVTIDYADVSVLGIGSPFSFNRTTVNGFSSMLGPENP